MSTVLWRATRWGLGGLLLGPAIAIVLVLAAMLLDPKCGAGDSGGCAMGLVTAPIAVALPSFLLGFALSLALQLWRRRPSDWGLAVRRLRRWGREE
jgi:hypothetical protein